MRTLKWMALVAATVLGASGARAGLFDQALSDEHAAGIQRLAVEVLVPDAATLAASYKGDESRAQFQPKALLADAVAKGFDAVLLVHRSWNENEPFAMPGLTLPNRKLPGLNRTVPCIGSYVRLLDARTGKPLARAGGDETCSTRNIKAGWRKFWSAYAPEEQAAIETIFKAAVDLQLRMALTDMHIGAGAR